MATRKKKDLTLRKGARSMADIPPDVLRALNRGELETITLPEWLAIDMAKLLRAVLPKVGLKKEAVAILKAYKPLAGLGVTRRLKGIGAILHDTIGEHNGTNPVYESLATHRSDMVRTFAAYTNTANEALSLTERIKRARRFAADGAGSVRECAWDSFRDFLADDLGRGIGILERWVRSKDANVRRCAVEATRPCGVWTSHIEALKEEPQIGLPILEPVRSDRSRYVQNAVGNWLNDASKTQPRWVTDLCDRWSRESPTRETDYIVKRATRTLRKKDGGGEARP